MTNLPSQSSKNSISEKTRLIELMETRIMVTKLKYQTNKSQTFT